LQSVHVVRRPPKMQLHKERDKGEPGAPKSNAVDAFDIVWSVDKQQFVGAAGKDAKAAYVSLAKSDASATLAQDSFAQSVLGRLGGAISFALVVDTARLSGDTGGAQKGTIVIAYGKDPKLVDRAWLELDVPPAVLTNYASVLGGLLGAAGAAPAAGTRR
jgi:hypothetical protein